jgi:hypothetical protein
LYADPDPDPAAQINADPCGPGSGYGSGSETLTRTVTVQVFKNFILRSRKAWSDFVSFSSIMLRSQTRLKVPGLVPLAVNPEVPYGTKKSRKLAEKSLF